MERLSRHLIVRPNYGEQSRQEKAEENAPGSRISASSAAPGPPCGKGRALLEEDSSLAICAAGHNRHPNSINAKLPVDFAPKGRLIRSEQPIQDNVCRRQRGLHFV